MAYKLTLKYFCKNKGKRDGERERDREKEGGAGERRNRKKEKHANKASWRPPATPGRWAPALCLSICTAHAIKRENRPVAPLSRDRAIALPRTDHRCSQQNKRAGFNCSLTGSSQRAEEPKTGTQQTGVCAHGGMLFGYKKEGSTAPCCGVDEPWRPHAPWKKPGMDMRATRCAIPPM